VALAHLLRRHRGDVKILANRLLAIFVELEELFIFTNPLRANAAGNTASIKSCLAHLQKGGLLVLFPAGRVSYPVRHGAPIRDHQWNRMVSSLARKVKCSVVPLHISGQNRPLFYRLGLLWQRLRMLMLVREMLQSRGKTIPISIGRPAALPLTIKDPQQVTDLYRLLTYLLNPQYLRSWPSHPRVDLAAIADPVAPSVVVAEIFRLPEEQCLLRYRTFAVYYCWRDQAPTVVAEIQRLREENFRPLDEGSGQSRDGDQFDESYIHLFVFDHQKQCIVGAYRMGQTDTILLNQGVTGLYLSQMFDFEENFTIYRQPCLEMGRSFVVAGKQRSYNPLLLLFKGIGAFVCRFPRYRVLYGTVSLSCQYQPLSVDLLAAPAKLLKRYLGENSENYLSHWNN
jgi:putative hemolysin